MGLMKAARAFDESRGVKFSTYAVPVILGEIKRLFRDGGSVKVSRSVRELSLKLSRYRDGFIAEHGREPTVSELSMYCGQSEEAVTEAIAAGQPTVSLTVAGEDGVDEIDIPCPSPENGLIELMALKKALAGLEDRDRTLIFLRYFRNKTQVETAAVLGMTQVQVSRREKKLLGILREKFM
jgi:RNA polymerase sporulation-specific sigma factor